MPRMEWKGPETANGRHPLTLRTGEAYDVSTAKVADGVWLLKAVDPLTLESTVMRYRGERWIENDWRPKE